MNTEIAIYEEPTDVVMFGGDAASDMLDVIRVQVVQSKHILEGNHKGGNFFDPLTGLEFDRFQAVPLHLQPKRTYFPSGEFAKGVKPICKSYDGVTPVLDDDDIVPQCESCAKCPHSQWIKNGKKQKPPCQEQFDFTFADALTGLVFRLTIKGSSITDFKNIRKGLNRCIGIARAQGNPRPFYGFSFEMRPTKVQAKSGTFYQIVFGDIVPLANPRQFRTEYEQVQANKVREQEEENADGVIDSVVDNEV